MTTPDERPLATVKASIASTLKDAEIARLTAELGRLEADYQELQATQDRQWARCPDGCGCRLATDDAAKQECGCDGPCTMECQENGYPDAPSYRDLAVRRVMDERDDFRIRLEGALLAEAQARVDLAEAREQLASVRADRDLFNRQRNELAGERDALGEKTDLLEAECTERADSETDLRGERDALSNELLAVRATLASEREELATCRERNAAIAAQLDQYRDERDDARGKLDEIRAMVDATRPHFSAEQLRIVLHAIREEAGLEPAAGGESWRPGEGGVMETAR